jgi:hypothetical protein
MKLQWFYGMLKLKNDTFLILGGENIRDDRSEEDFEAFEFSLEKKEFVKVGFKSHRGVYPNSECGRAFE